MKKITLEEIQKQKQLKEYNQLYSYIAEQVKMACLKPVKASGLNGKKPALYQTYWILEKEEDLTPYLEELHYQILPVISTDYYRNHLQQYKQDRHWVQMLNTYLKEHSEKLKQAESMNERSFEIWKREKFLKQEQGKKILLRCGISLEQLNLYETTEPLAYYSHSRIVPQNLLIIENKDTFYSMRRHLLSLDAAQMPALLGCRIDTLIYGSGKGILRSFHDFSLCMEPYMIHSENQIYYFGDLDYEGIGIYENLASQFTEKEGETRSIVPFVPGYLAMLDKAADSLDHVQLPETKEGQNRNIEDRFFSYFTAEAVAQMKELLEQGSYIPQEILNIGDYQTCIMIF